jgi:hypothetical protein
MQGVNGRTELMFNAFCRREESRRLDRSIVLTPGSFSPSGRRIDDSKTNFLNWFDSECRSITSMPGGDLTHSLSRIQAMQRYLDSF